MDQNDHELISRYLDQELSVEERTALEARMQAEPDLRETLDRFRGVDQELCRAMAKEGHVPVETAAMLSKRDDKVAVLPRRKPQRWGLAMAASLLAGVAVISGPQWVADSQDNLLVPNIEESVAFSEILDNKPSQARGWLPVEDDVQMRPVLSFASTSGTWCREFMAAQNHEAWRGIACRREGDWNVELLVQTPGLAGESSGYQTASAETADLVARFIDKHSADIPLGLDAEAALIESDWR